MHGGFVVFIPCTEVLWLFSSNARRFRIFFSSERFCDFSSVVTWFFPAFFFVRLQFYFCKQRIFIFYLYAPIYLNCLDEIFLLYTVLKDVIKFSLTFIDFSVLFEVHLCTHTINIKLIDKLEILKYFISIFTLTRLLGRFAPLSYFNF